ncbi:MAG: hydrogenase maturation protease [Candidatus Omnitrophica bacterium]|nr:hydrogenase maturation protease [Candidatus Omnitrophota bacterium]
MANRIAVVGIGNTLRRDDGIGVTVLGSLLSLYKRERIDYLDFGSASFDLLNRMSSYDAMLVIDGIEASLEPGELKIARLEDITYDLKEAVTSTHGFGFSTLLELYKKLGAKTRVYIAGIQVADTSYGEGFTPQLADKKEEITGRISAFIDTVLLKGQ